MTPEQLAGLALLLMDFRDWLAEDVGETIEQQAVDYLIDVVSDQRNRLIMGGAR